MFPIAQPCGAAVFVSPQNRPHARQKLPQSERFREIVVGPELQADHAIYLVMSVRGNDDDRGIRPRPYLAEQVEPVFAIELEVKDHQARFTHRELSGCLLASRRGDHSRIMPGKIVCEHLSHRCIVINDENSAETATGGSANRDHLGRVMAGAAAVPRERAGENSTHHSIPDPHREHGCADAHAGERHGPPLQASRSRSGAGRSRKGRAAGAR